MSQTTLAIIGTAGRKEDQKLLTEGHYNRMVGAAVTLIKNLGVEGKDLKLVSGGAAWADHVAVSLVQWDIIPPENLTLFLPALLGPNGYEGNELEYRGSTKTADTANYYHILFSNRLGRDTREELRTVRNQGATFHTVMTGFHARNAMVAKEVTPDGNLLAFTFGGPNSDQQPWTVRRFIPTTKADDAGLKDGGTAHTWNNSKCFKWHAKIGIDLPPWKPK